MARQAIEIMVPIEDAWDAGDRLNVVTDFGTGTLDTGSLLLPRAIDLFPGKPGRRVAGRRIAGIGRAGDGRAARPRVGIGRTIAGRTPAGIAPPFVRVVVDVPAVFGVWKFAAVTVDEAENVQGDAPIELDVLISATEPEVVSTFALSAYDDVSDVATFVWE